MALHLTVQDELQVVVPVRFARAVVGSSPPRRTAPDIDDRGWSMPHPFGWTSVPNVRGPMVGLMQDEEVEISVLWEDLDWCVPLHVTLGPAPSAATVGGGPPLQILHPATGRPLRADSRLHRANIRIRGNPVTSASAQSIELRLGADDGPVVAEIEVQVFDPLIVLVQPRIVVIHGVNSINHPIPQTGRVPVMGPGEPVDSPRVMGRIMTTVRDVWRPAGVDVRVRPAITYHHPLTVADVPYEEYDHQTNTYRRLESRDIVNGHHTQGHCNVYLVRYLPNYLGMGLSKVHPRRQSLYGWNHPGVIVAVEGEKLPHSGRVTDRPASGASLYHWISNDIAHEIGHFLTLKHPGEINGTGLTDTYARRQLMHPTNVLPPADPHGILSQAELNAMYHFPKPRVDDVGYGSIRYLFDWVTQSRSDWLTRGFRGALLTMKRFSTLSTDGEVEQVRRYYWSQGGNIY